MSEHAEYVDPLNDQALEALLEYVNTEINRRTVLNTAEATLKDFNQRILNAAGLQPGAPWDPAMQHRGGYSSGWTVTHGPDRHTFESLIDANVWEPGDPADPQNYRWWKNLTDAPQGDEWNPNDHPYAVGDEVDFEGSRYRCRQTHRSQPGWTPAAVPALWEKLD